MGWGNGLAAEKRWAQERRTMQGEIDRLKAEGARSASNLSELAARYLEVRGHVLSTAPLRGFERVQGQANYVIGEAEELLGAVHALGETHFNDVLAIQLGYRNVRCELADVIISATFLAHTLETTPEACIAEKTELDRGRG